MVHISKLKFPMMKMIYSQILNKHKTFYSFKIRIKNLNNNSKPYNKKNKLISKNKKK